jgi:hypothetical protein
MSPGGDREHWRLGSPSGTVRIWLIALAALVAASAFAGAASAQSSSGSGELFVQRASDGRLVPVPGKPGVFNLTLAVPTPVVAFTDRPARQVRTESLASFSARWSGRGFANDPPTRRS